MVYKEGHGMYGHCWIEGNGSTFYVYICDGKTQKGPYSSLTDAINEYSHWCA